MLCLLRTFNNDDKAYSKEFGFSIIPIIVMMIALVCEISFSEYNFKVFAKVIQNLAFGCIFPAILLFYFRISKNENFISRPFIFAIYAIPIITFVVYLTNDVHYMFASKFYLSSGAHFSLIRVEYGLWLDIITIVTYVFIFFSVIILFINCGEQPPLYRGRHYAYLGSIFVALIVNLVVGNATVALSVGAILCFWSMNIYENHEIPDTVKNLTIDLISPVMIFDHKDKLISANARAEQRFNIGKDDFKNLTFQDVSKNMLNIDNFDSFTGSEVVVCSTEKYYYSVESKPLIDKRNIYVGRYLILNDITNFKVLTEKLEFSVMHDSVTGFMNASFYKEKILELHDTDVLRISILMIRILETKAVSSIFGSAFILKIIKAVSLEMKAIFEEGDLYARTEFDEFSVTFINKSEDEVRVLVEKLISSCRKNYPDLFIRISYGISSCIPSRQTLQDNIDMIYKTSISKMSVSSVLSIKDAEDGLLQYLKTYMKNSYFESEAYIEKNCNLAIKIGEKLGFVESELEKLSLLVVLYNIGLIVTYIETGKKVSDLTNEEWYGYRMHTIQGYNIAVLLNETKAIARDILSHHERYDGLGYPNMLCGENIPINARILNVVNYYGKRANTTNVFNMENPVKVLKKMEKLSNSRFDPRIVEILKDIIEESYDGSSDLFIID